MQNAIKLENISNLITHINGMYVCVLGIRKGKFSKQMEKKYLVFKFVMTGCDFVMTDCDFVMTGCRNFRFIKDGHFYSYCSKLVNK